MGETQKPHVGWYAIERDPEGRETVAHWERYSSQSACEDAIRHLHIPAAGLLSARLWTGEKWL